MIIVYAVFMFVNAWIADRSFRNRRVVWGLLCAAISAYCFVEWVRGVSEPDHPAIYSTPTTPPDGEGRHD